MLFDFLESWPPQKKPRPPPEPKKEKKTLKGLKGFTARDLPRGHSSGTETLEREPTPAITQSGNNGRKTGTATTSFYFLAVGGLKSKINFKKILFYSFSLIFLFLLNIFFLKNKK